MAVPAMLEDRTRYDLRALVDGAQTIGETTEFRIGDRIRFEGSARTQTVAKVGTGKDPILVLTYDDGTQVSMKRSHMYGKFSLLPSLPTHSQVGTIVPTLPGKVSPIGDTAAVPAEVAAVPMTYEEACACRDAIVATEKKRRFLMLDMYERQGWKALGYATWEECCKKEFGYHRQSVYRTVRLAHIERALWPQGAPWEIAEAILEPMRDLPEGQWKAAMERALERAKEPQTRNPLGRRTEHGLSGTIMRAVVKAMLAETGSPGELHRKQAEREQRREQVIKHLQQSPGKLNSEIAKACRMSASAVGTIRQELEAKGKLPKSVHPGRAAERTVSAVKPAAVRTPSNSLDALGETPLPGTFCHATASLDKTFVVIEGRLPNKQLIALRVPTSELPALLPGLQRALPVPAGERYPQGQVTSRRFDRPNNALIVRSVCGCCCREVEHHIPIKDLPLIDMYGE